MPISLERSLRRPKNVPAPTRIRLTRRQCEALVESCELKGRYELIDGEIISKMGQSRRHALGIILLNAWLTATFGPLFIQIQLPIDVAESDNEINEPEPDGAVFRETATVYSNDNPGPNDVLLIVEIADTSLRFDLRTKAARYSRAGIADYWVLDIVGRRLYVHREPTEDGYRNVTVYAEGESLASLARPDAEVRVGELLPPLMGEGTES